MGTALMVIDVQNALVEEGPYACEKIIENIDKLIKQARLNNLEVIYVQHIGDVGSELEDGSEGGQIYNVIAPKPGEAIFTKQYNSAFKETGLREYLTKRNIDELIITGMQTEYCIDTSCKVAFEFGYRIVIPELTNTTYSNELFEAEDIYKHYNYKIFKDRFATLESIEKTIERMDI